MDDLISRQAAINTAMVENKPSYEIAADLRALPSAKQRTVTDGDTISRRAAVSRMSDLIVLELKCERPPTYNEVYRAMNDLPPAQQWIPCSERLPEMYDAGILKKFGIQKRSKYVFITIASGDEKLVDADAELRDGKWHSDTLRWISADGRKVEVTAWMPYPEPYREESNEQVD